MSKPSAAAIPVRRPWYRLHASTWLVFPLGLAAAVSVMLPGGLGHYPEHPSWVPSQGSTLGEEPYGDSATVQDAIVHGWPLPYLWCTPEGWVGDPARADPYLQSTWKFKDPARRFRYLPWRLTDSVREFRLVPLLTDIAVMAVCVAAFVGLVEMRRRRRHRAIQFTLRELLVVATVAAVAVGWWTRERAANLALQARLSNHHTTLQGTLDPNLPLWVRTLVGDRRLTWLGLSRPRGPFTVTWSGRQRDDLQYVVDRFPHEAIIKTIGELSGEDASAIASIARLERIECRDIPAADMTRLLEKLKGHPNLRGLSIVLRPNASIDDADMALIATIPRLESLSIPSSDLVTPRGLVKLRDCKFLTVFEFDNLGWLTKGTLDAVGDLSQLRRLNLRNSKFVDANLSMLTRLDRLEELDLSGTNIDDRQFLQLRSLPNLRCLNIRNYGVTRSGVKRLLNPSDDGFGRNLEQISLDATLIDDELIDMFKKLPRLRMIGVVWENDGGPADLPSISKLRQALPHDDIVDLQFTLLLLD